jgi:hypothetical protein
MGAEMEVMDGTAEEVFNTDRLVSSVTEEYGVCRVSFHRSSAKSRTNESSERITYRIIWCAQRLW